MPLVLHAIGCNKPQQKICYKGHDDICCNIFQALRQSRRNTLSGSHPDRLVYQLMTLALRRSFSRCGEQCLSHALWGLVFWASLLGIRGDNIDKTVCFQVSLAKLKPQKRCLMCTRACNLLQGWLPSTLLNPGSAANRIVLKESGC